jgi:Ser/Thr protein kinase RdoA (MazF antagonist)
MHPLLDLPLEEAREWLAPHAPGATDLEPLTSGHQNSNYRVRRPDPAEDLLLRLHARGPEVARIEWASMELGRAAAPVPDLLARDPEGLRSRPTSLQTFLPGRTLEQWLDASPTPEAAGEVGRQLGELLAGLDAIRLPQAGFFTLAGDSLKVNPSERPGGLHPFVAFALERLARPAVRAHLDPGEPEAITRFLGENDRYLPDFDAPAVLGHGDFKPVNLLVDDDPEGPVVTGLLDWEYAWAAPPRSDLATMLRWEDELPEPLVDGLLAAYRAGGGELPDGWRRATLLADLTAQVDFLDRGEERPRVIADARDRIASTMARWDDLPA